MNFLKGLLKFSPVFLLAGLMIAQYDALIAAPIAAIYAFIVAGITEKIKFQDSLNAAMKSVNNILIALFILMFECRRKVRRRGIQGIRRPSRRGSFCSKYCPFLGCDRQICRCSGHPVYGNSLRSYGNLVGDVCRMRADIHVAQSYRRRKSVSHGMRYSRRRMLWR